MNMKTSSSKLAVIFVGILIKIKFSTHIVEDNYQVSSNSIQWEPSCFMPMDGQTADRHDEINSRFSLF